MKTYAVKAYLSAQALPQTAELAYALAGVAAAQAPLDAAAVAMVQNRIIDNAAVALAAINDRPVAVARSMALRHPPLATQGAAIMGVPAHTLVSAEWAAWANGTAVRQLDYHDTFLAHDYSHPADNIPPLLAVAQNLRERACTGTQLIRAILSAYEIQVALVKGISLHAHAIDHIAHLGVSAAAGLGTLLQLPQPLIYQALQQALHVTITTRQSRKGLISSWKAYAPAHAGKLAIEAVDRCARGEGAPSPIYEGEDSVIAKILGGMDATYTIMLPAADEPLKGILETYTKAHSAEYQSQAIIDLAFEIRTAGIDLTAIKELVIHTSHHTHKVIGTGSGDPQKFDPKASRETLDHSLMYIFAVALEDGSWHHVDSYTPERAARSSTLALWRKISTREDAHWTKLYHATDSAKKAFGARVELKFTDGNTRFFAKTVADAHPNGKAPFTRDDYIRKFKMLSAELITAAEQERFIETVLRLEQLSGTELLELNVPIPAAKLRSAPPVKQSIFG